MLIPKDSTEGLNGAKSQVDFAINSIYLTLLIFLQYIAFAIYTKSLPEVWIPLVALVLTHIPHVSPQV
jgi:hypothetical protein